MTTSAKGKCLLRKVRRAARAEVGARKTLGGNEANCDYVLIMTKEGRKGRSFYFLLTI